MKRILVSLVLLLAPVLANDIDVSIGHPFGINVGFRTGIIPVLADLRLYVSGGAPSAGGIGFGGGADLLLHLPLLPFYTGIGAFYGTAPAISLINQGNFGARAILGTDFGIPLISWILPVGVYAEIYPTLYLGGASQFGLSGVFGVKLRL
jgi:hypothetical protein